MCMQLPAAASPVVLGPKDVLAHELMSGQSHTRLTASRQAASRAQSQVCMTQHVALVPSVACPQQLCLLRLQVWE